MTLRDCMCQEKKDEGDSLALKIASIHQYNGSKTAQKSAGKDYLKSSETIQKTQASTEQNNQKRKMGRKTTVWIFQTINKQNLK